MRKRKYRGIESIKSRYGFMFALPWLIGFLTFFFVPLIQSIKYSFSDVTFSTQGVQTKFIGFEAYKYYLFEDPKFTTYLLQDLSSLIYSLPIILLISLVLAMLLNQKFKGRLFFRALYFLPVIIASGVVIDLLFRTTDEELISAGVNVAFTDSMFSVEDVMSIFITLTRIILLSSRSLRLKPQMKTTILILLLSAVI